MILTLSAAQRFLYVEFCVIYFSTFCNFKFSPWPEIYIHISFNLLGLIVCLLLFSDRTWFMMNVVNLISFKIWGFSMANPWWPLWLIFPWLLKNNIFWEEGVCVFAEDLSYVILYVSEKSSTGVVYIFFLILPRIWLMNIDDLCNNINNLNSHCVFLSL